MGTFTLIIHASDKKTQDFYRKVFPNFTRVEEKIVVDTISDEAVNTIILKVFAEKKHIGFIRNIYTTTGCDSACLPVSYTSFYDKKGQFIKNLSQDGLTKINHAPFTAEDYARLDLIVSLSPHEFGKIKHPKELTDALSGATLKVYEPIVVEGAAYSTLRIHLYNVDTINWIKKLK